MGPSSLTPRVPCRVQCNYVIYWRRYARFVEDALGAEEAARVWERATGKLLKRRPEPFIDFALFRESQGQVDAARELYKHLLDFGNVHAPAPIPARVTNVCNHPQCITLIRGTG